MLLNLKTLYNGLIVLPSLQKNFTAFVFSDKVLHKIRPFGIYCNTSSGGHHDVTPQAHSTNIFPFRAATVLENQPACDGTAIRSTVGQAFPGTGRLLQQLHAQRCMVYACIHSTVQPHRSVVLRENRVFQSRQPDRHHYRDDPPQSCGDDR